MNPDEFRAPEEGFVITHLLVVADQDRSREFYRSLFEGQVVLERDPVIMKVANTWLMLNVGGGPLTAARRMPVWAGLDGGRRCGPPRLGTPDCVWLLTVERHGARWGGALAWRAGWRERGGAGDR
jgi:hypothetical protein